MIQHGDFMCVLSTQDGEILGIFKDSRDAFDMRDRIVEIDKRMNKDNLIIIEATFYAKFDLVLYKKEWMQGE
ncbi:hypothetical protein [Marinitoga sp. 1138]|uniref:hypothetical protein n=1 Tax=Marinitoga sp. 1138 TaxID=1643334 RepID=UPI0015860283|nr:hypothetical protein [Marinitoga sp. 1138]NUU96738.1 hypothetical protein [Marinitoga sp. 1138]